ncbi:hypothetical protein [Myxococcus sp. RHSTA-1-4]|uniref:hypothetical protein n=1 Tax=Myxococcus sp. RHSTA-1-4 TaxID=2874601 RepID=UPI001CBC5FE0|nr:hypothetical protein [Myxococcus sp. RHSTA-1-4]MBZ4422282.1 hypothetical protein [Myxococcus sp. RHSTA-1-4]
MAIDIHRWMVRFVTDHPVRLPQQGPFTWQAADIQRPSNVLLIHGGRGSGKTSVMLTLLELWRRSLTEGLECPSPDCDEPPAEGGRAGASREASNTSCQDDDREGREDQRTLDYLLAGMSFKDALKEHAKAGCIIPLKPLDLQPLPRSASILTWIASRIYEFATLIEQLATGTLEGIPPQPIASWHPESRNEAPWHKPWREFATAAAYGWESNLDQRRGGLDPESFAEELTQTERSRHEVVVKWRAFVTAVVEYACRQFPRTIKGKARLVLPIDDVDMNPNRCVEVLELVRFLWHPQLVFMLTGQSHLFVKMLRIAHHGLMRGELGSGGINRSEFQSLDARPSAHEIAVQAYDRVIPPGQRFALDPLTPDLRLYHLVRLLYSDLLNKPPSAISKDVRQWLVELKSKYKLLVEFLERFEQRPFLLVGLPRYFRRLRNLEHALLRVAARERPVTHAELVYIFWHDAIENQAFSRGSDKGLRHAVQFPDTQAADGSWTRTLRVSLDEPLRQRGQPRSRPLLTHEDLRYELSTVDGFVWKVRGDFPREVPDHLTALLVLAIDVAADEEDELGGAFQVDGLVAPHIRVSVPIRLASGVLQVRFSWPTPDWVGSTYARYANDYWNQGIGKPWPDGVESASREEVFKQMLAIFLGSLAWAHGEKKPGEAPTAIALDWEEALKQLLDLQKQFTEREPEEGKPARKSPALHRRALLDWIDERLFLLAAPESGLPETLSWKLMHALVDGGIKPSRSELSRLKRAQSALEQVKPAKVELRARGLLQQLDEQLMGAGRRWPPSEKEIREFKR